MGNGAGRIACGAIRILRAGGLRSSPVRHSRRRHQLSGGEEVTARRRRSTCAAAAASAARGEGARSQFARRCDPAHQVGRCN
jgi:hypothetical protein